MRDFFRSIFTAQEWSSTNLTDKIGCGDKTGLGICGLRQAPLYLMIKISPPSKAPCDVLPGKLLEEEEAEPYDMVMDLPER